jgi:hypothetical protein
MSAQRVMDVSKRVGPVTPAVLAGMTKTTVADIEALVADLTLIASVRPGGGRLVAMNPNPPPPPPMQEQSKVVEWGAPDDDDKDEAEGGNDDNDNTEVDKRPFIPVVARKDRGAKVRAERERVAQAFEQNKLNILDIMKSDDSKDVSEDETDNDKGFSVSELLERLQTDFDVLMEYKACHAALFRLLDDGKVDSYRTEDGVTLWFATS